MDELRPRHAAGLPSDYVRGGLLHPEAASEPDAPAPDKSVETIRQSGGTLIILGFMGCAAAMILLVSFWVLNGFSPHGFGVGTRTPHDAAAGPSSHVNAGAPAPSSSLSPKWPAPYFPPAIYASGAPSRAAAPRTDPHGISNVIVDAPNPPDNPSSQPNSSSGGAPSSSPTTPPVTSSSAPPVNPDTLPVNAPGAAVDVASVNIGPGSSAAPPSGDTADTTQAFLTVTLTGLSPRINQANLMASVVDWGDAQSTDLLQPPAPAVAGTYSHTYAGPGTYSISWTYTSDRVHTWTHTIKLTAAAQAAPAPTLVDGGVVDDAGGKKVQTFQCSDTGIWTDWVMDFGDGQFASGDNTNQPTGPIMHTYDGTGHTAVLTVTGQDGQLVTRSLSTP